MAEYSKAFDEVNVSMDSEEKPFVSVLPTMIKTFGVEFFTGTFMKFTYDILQFVGPLILKWDIDWDSKIQKWNEC